MRYSREYSTWCAMKNRCKNATHAQYPQYGGRGIYVCDRWLNSFENFLADMGPRLGGSIDRIDNDGPYEPGNCRWASRSEQARNKRSSRRLTANGETRSMAEWAELSGLKLKTIHRRLEQGWTEQDAVTVPVITQRKGIPRGQLLREHVGAERGVRFTAPEVEHA